MSDYGWKPYVPVAKRRAQAENQIKKVRKAGKSLEPVIITTRTMATTFWGKAWCKNLEAYSDHQNRLPRARTYVRNGAIIDLKINSGRVIAQVIGSKRYQVEIDILPLPNATWHELIEACTGSIESLVELLQGQFSKAVMGHICDTKTGLFPSPAEIKFVCSCPDSAQMCKHVAATLYGVGARLDVDAKLLFILRQVDANDLLTAQTGNITENKKIPKASRILSDASLNDIFGIELAAIDTPNLTKGNS
jgi:uncharacterized Zn finger protein